MRLFLIFLLPTLSSPFQAIYYINNKCIRISKRLAFKIKYCPYLKNQKNNVIEKYSQTTSSLNKKLRYLKIINAKNINNIYDENLVEETITTSSLNISDELVDEVKKSLSFLLDFNKEYTTILTLIMTEIIRYELNKNINKNFYKITIPKIIVRNIFIPFIIHELFQLLFHLLKIIFIH